MIRRCGLRQRHAGCMMQSRSWDIFFNPETIGEKNTFRFPFCLFISAISSLSAMTRFLNIAKLDRFPFELQWRTEIQFGQRKGPRLPPPASCLALPAPPTSPHSPPCPGHAVRISLFIFVVSIPVWKAGTTCLLKTSFIKPLRPNYKIVQFCLFFWRVEMFTFYLLCFSFIFFVYFGWSFETPGEYANAAT